MPLFQSLILHGGLLSLFLFGFNQQNAIVEPQAEPEIVQAMVLDETKLQAEVERLRNEEDRQRRAEANRQKQLENRSRLSKISISRLRAIRIARSETL